MGTVNHFEDIARRLIETDSGRQTLAVLTRTLIQDLRQIGVPLSRVNLGVFALHPEMAGYAVHWEEGMDQPTEVPIRREDTLLSVYLESPIRRMVDNGKPLQFDLTDPSAVQEFSILTELSDQGHTDYRGFPIAYGTDGISVLTLCTRDSGGFSSEHIVGITKLFPVLRLLIEIVETRRLAKTVLRTYLGRHTGEMVLEGKILRGEGETIQAVLWLCDLRGFTAMTEEVGTYAMVDVMNQYFECLGQAVWEEGGEILKFMGDAMLVVFRITPEMPVREAAMGSLRAARAVHQRLPELETGPLDAGIAIHLGEVVYGNIGAKSRLDFTVMGNAVNIVARLQQLGGELKEPILLTGPVAKHLVGAVLSIGDHRFKGIRDTIEVFRTESAVPPT